jgi:PhnB protein
MAFSVFLSFDGNCREAAEFYARVFRTEVKNLLTYGQTPPSEQYPLDEADSERIMFCGVDICGCEVMLMDMPSKSEEKITSGTQITMSIDDKSQDEVRRLFRELGDGGAVLMPLGPMFFSELYGMVADKFGVSWNIMHDSGNG